MEITQKEDTLPLPELESCAIDYIPSQNSFEFPEISFTSKFDSGNLLKAIRVKDYEYQLWVSPDCYNTKVETTHASWFYYKVTGFKIGEPYTFHFKNNNKQSKLLKEGMKPVYKTNCSQGKWQRIPGALWNIDEFDPKIKFSFSFTFHPNQTEVHFAYTYPWSYQDNNVKHHQGQPLILSSPI